MTDFSPLSALWGGAMIGAAAVLLMLANGRIMGIAGIFGGLLGEPDRAWRLAFLAGMTVPALVLGVHNGIGGQSLEILLAAGFLVGLGSRMSNGCTSGHGICGLARGSVRSLAAVVTFMTVAALTVTVRSWL